MNFCFAVGRHKVIDLQAVVVAMDFRLEPLKRDRQSWILQLALENAAIDGKCKSQILGHIRMGTEDKFGTTSQVRPVENLLL